MRNNLQQSFLEYVQIKNLSRDLKPCKEDWQEEIDVYDSNQKRIKTIFRGEKIEQDESIRCVLCFVIDKQGNVIIEHKRNGEKDGCSGHIKAYEVGLQAVLRELYEELGIDIEEGLHVNQLGNIKIMLQGQPCILEIYCLFRTKDTHIETNTDEINTIEKMPFEIFIEKFLNGEIFPYTSEYEPIIQELVRQWKEQFHKEKVTNWER